MFWIAQFRSLSNVMPISNISRAFFFKGSILASAELSRALPRPVWPLEASPRSSSYLLDASPRFSSDSVPEMEVKVENVGWGWGSGILLLTCHSETRKAPLPHGGLSKAAFRRASRVNNGRSTVYVVAVVQDTSSCSVREMHPCLNSGCFFSKGKRVSV